ncbi:MAG TPA: hypothetical protein VI814_12920 [Candidatus Limnocylindria bacterium]
MPDEELGAVLADIGARLALPRAPLAPSVVARLRERRRSARRWTLRMLAPALATLVLLLAIVAVASPEVRAAAREILRIGGIEIFPVPTVSPRPSASATPLSISGQRMTLEDARRAVGFAVRVPDVPVLGSPDDVIVDTTPVQRVTLVYREREGIPTSPVAGVAALVVEVRGDVEPTFFGKGVGPDTKIEPVTVAGSPGYWLEGAPHFFFVRTADGSIRDETLRLAGNTLVWVDDGVTYRLEAQVSRDEALRIASSFR